MKKNLRSFFTGHLLFYFMLIGYVFPGFLPLTPKARAGDFRVMWYNVENLFDTEDDPFMSDNEFLPTGERRWTPKRYHHKLQQISRVISAAGEWQTPAIIGLAEVENDSVLTHLTERTPLRHQHYRYCITTGSDTRGINVAILYQRDKFAHIGDSSLPVKYREGRKKPTRDILHVWGKVASGDTLDIFACHFPSRSGGEKESEGFRLDAAYTLRSYCDSIFQVRQSAHLILMGDFNDTPVDRSVTGVLHAIPFKKETSAFTHKDNEELILYNLYANTSSFPFAGSHKYQGEWNMLDQIIINQRFLSPSSHIRLQPQSMRIFAPSFLLTKDRTGRGKRPKRSYYGYRYEGGFSDHLPLIIDLVIKN